MLFEQFDHDMDGVIGAYDLQVGAWVLGELLFRSEAERFLSTIGGRAQKSP